MTEPYPIHSQKEKRQDIETNLRIAGARFVEDVKAKEQFIADKVRYIYGK